MMIDQHTHTKYSPDADQKTTFLSYVNQARLLGFSGVMVTDHVDYDSTDPLFQHIIDYDAYFEDIENIKSQTGFDLRVGVELGYQSCSIEKMNQLVLQYPFDLVIMSLHLIDGQDPYYGQYFEGKTQEESYKRYFEAVLDAVQQFDDFDVFGHFDHIIRYGDFESRIYDIKTYEVWIDAILKVIIRKGKGIEINMSGIDDITKSPYPSLDVLKRYKALGGKIITVGSDAHCFSDLGRYFQDAKSILIEAGFDQIAIYHKRKPIFFNIDEVL
jgi:histidinol-phosphatase (PHP family)